MKFTPLPYQLQAKQHLLDHREGALFVGLGLGKTVTTLSAFLQKFYNGEARTMLVVAPLRVALLTWPNEVAKWEDFDFFPVCTLRKDKDYKTLLDKKAVIYTINYENLPKLAEFMEENPSVNFDIVVYDELTKAKNPKSTRIKAWRKVTDKRKFIRWGLTGTPQPNSALELWGQISLLDGGTRLSPTYYGYRQAYFDSDWSGYNWTPKAGALTRIHNKISDICLVLKSEDYLDIPETILEDIEVTLPDEAKEVYKRLEKDLIATLTVTDTTILAANRAVLAGKLLQVCGGSLYDEERNVFDIHGAKVEALRELIKETKEPMMVVCSYRHEMDRLKRDIPGIELFSDYKSAEEVCDKWNAGKIPVMVVHPAAVGHGLNLQQGGRIICWYSMTWSRELYDQTNARLARKGQVKQPIIYRLLIKNGIDEACAETLRERGEAQGELLTTIKNLQKLLT